MAESVTITDNRNGESIEIPIVNGGVDAGDWKKLLGNTWFYDPGFTQTACTSSAITEIDGDAGILRYRGYPIEQLAENSTYLEVAYLLIYGELPNAEQFEIWKHEITYHTFIHENVRKRFMEGFHYDAHPMGMLVSAFGALSTFYHEAKDIDDPEVRNKQIVRLVAKVPTLAACAHRFSVGQPFVYPDNTLDFASNFLSMMWKVAEPHYEPNPVLAHALDVLFILHADHEQNCGTAAMRVIGSSHPDPYSCCAGAAAALYGPRHGGANEAVIKMLNEIGSVDNVDAFVKGVKEGKGRLQGFGHRVYKNFDPRATIIKKIAYDVFEITGKNPLLDIALKLEETALSDDYFISRKLYPNVDFYSGLIYQAMDFPIDTFTVLFAIPRVSGWLAHWKELLEQDQKIARPRQLYIGAEERNYVPMVSRLNLAYRPTLAASNESRVSARLIDVVIEFTIAGIILALGPTGRPLAGDFLVVVAITAYETIFLTTLGATPGKLALGLRVATLDHEGPVPVVAAFRRGFVVALCFGVLSVGVALAIIIATSLAVSIVLSAHHRAYHDRMSGTVVVARGAPPLITSDDVEQWYSADALPVFTVWGLAVGLEERRRARSARLDQSPLLVLSVVAAATAVTAWLHSAWALVWMCLLWLVVFTIDETLQVARTGTTAGHREAGYEIVDITTGGHPSMGRSFARAVVLGPLLYVPPLQLILAIWVNASATNRGPHDLAGHTQVVDRHAVPRTLPEPPPMWGPQPGWGPQPANGLGWGPQPAWGAPQPGWGPPPPGWGAPQPGWNPPPPDQGAPAPAPPAATRDPSPSVPPPPPFHPPVGRPAPLPPLPPPHPEPAPPATDPTPPGQAF